MINLRCDDLDQYDGSRLEHKTRMNLGHTTRNTEDLLATTLELQVGLLFAIVAFHSFLFFRSRRIPFEYTMKVIRYRTSVDPDVKYDPEQFAREVAIYLADPHGWAQFVEFVPAKTGKHIRLSSPSTLTQNGCANANLSCATLGGTDIWLNSERWMRGAPASKLPLEQYRQYMVSHEMGHSLGYEHVKNPGYGPAPIMLQQTLGIGKCSPNTKLTRIDLSISSP